MAVIKITIILITIPLIYCQFIETKRLLKTLDGKENYKENKQRSTINKLRGNFKSYLNEETKSIFLSDTYLRLPYSLSGVFSYQPLTLLIRVGYPQSYISWKA